MELTVNGNRTYCYTGGRPFEATKPTVVFIHGVLNDHSVWILQSRYLAHHGFNVLAVDLPGHCRSEGEAPSTVEEAAGFVAALLDAAGVAEAALVGHSWGSLIALEAAAILLALLVFVVPRQPRVRPLFQVCALAAAVTIAVQLPAVHWFYYYVIWFLPFVLVALFARRGDVGSEHDRTLAADQRPALSEDQAEQPALVVG